MRSSRTISTRAWCSPVGASCHRRVCSRPDNIDAAAFGHVLRADLGHRAPGDAVRPFAPRLNKGKQQCFPHGKTDKDGGECCKGASEHSGEAFISTLAAEGRE